MVVELLPPGGNDLEFFINLLNWTCLRLTRFWEPDVRESVDVTLSLIYLVGPLLTELIMGSELGDCLGYLAFNIIFYLWYCY